ncbi:SH3 domain-containing protein [Helicobacter turcicus]|uniref:SH3 domain-containing protein n=1 Tax=Helicobacter turcicus TaxID=2867412 RepID=A0ABS7JQ74_9HELI|nr:SH3 domain-containing protein [Helicobacter turcicus]MBX7491557.1 SH3 domain-containing protein [Helicobacter turcicus]MBX7546408.1 SH3 domain-containing protein [Helicobacter turcicus]
MLRIAVFCMGLGALVLIMEFFLKAYKLEAKHLQSKSAQKPCFYVQANVLNVRQNPNMQAKILQTLQKGEKVCMYFGVENGFLHIANGYVATQYLSLNTPPKPNVTTPLEQTPKILLTSTQKAPKQRSLHLARLAMHNQDYTTAKTLALEINQDNPKNIESWEIFAKALYLEGNKNEAILILQNFLLQNSNHMLLELLEQMRKGERI